MSPWLVRGSYPDFIGWLVRSSYPQFLERHARGSYPRKRLAKGSKRQYVERVVQGSYHRFYMMGRASQGSSLLYSAPREFDE